MGPRSRVLDGGKGGAGIYCLGLYSLESWPRCGHGERSNASLVGVYGAMPPLGPRGKRAKPLVRGSSTKPPEAESNFKTEQYCTLHLTILHFGAFRYFVCHIYTMITAYIYIGIHMPLMQKHI